jgi:DUF1680 family protein
MVRVPVGFLAQAGTLGDGSIMSAEFTRRDFLRLAAALPGALAIRDSFAAPSVPAAASRWKLEPFDYHGVRLLQSRWQEQYQSARDFYYGVSNDDILHGYRVAAGLPAPGKTLGGWAARNSDIVFGQWLSGMARMFCATGDEAIRDKADFLLLEWADTIGPDGDCRMSLYSYDKLLCGLVDLQLYAGVTAAAPLLERTMAWVMRSFSKERMPGSPTELNGRPSEWYTLAENIYRAYELTGNAMYRSFAGTYLYPYFWNKFEDTAAPRNAYHVHAYSHVNTFSSAAMAYGVTGDPVYLSILRNAHECLQNTQCYATGGYGPMERLVPPDGTLGRSLEARNASFETVCGSWAGFKMARYLTCFTGEARYGDWMERLFYNGVGAALPIIADGKHFYYSDYRVTGGMKVYKVSRYSCCSGSYAQAVADYHNLIYYRGPSSLYVNLYLPSEVTWQSPEGEIKLTQTTTYPEAETSTLRLEMKQPGRFTLKFRVPEWTSNASAKINGLVAAVDTNPGTWAEITRTWAPGDKVEIRIPLHLRMVPVDREHPRRVAVVRGPVVLVMDDWVFEDIPRLPEPADVETWLVPDEQQSGLFRIVPPSGKAIQARFRPFYAVGEVTPYRIYHDLDSLPIPVW